MMADGNGTIPTDLGWLVTKPDKLLLPVFQWFPYMLFSQEGSPVTIILAALTVH